MAAGPVSDPDGSIARQVAAAVAATTLPIDQARLRMANAAFPDGKAPSEAELDRQARAAQADRAKAGVKVDHSPLPPATPEAILNGEIWSNSLDALQAGAGKPEVRAGVLDLLATIPGVQVRHTTTDGKAALELDSAPWSDGYVEQLVIDADTGTPIRFTGGYPGKQPSVTVTYTVTRVTATQIAKG
jgi:hypothetical protein